MTGMGSNNSRGVFDNVQVRVLAPQVTFDQTIDLRTSTGSLGVPGRDVDVDE